MTQLDNHAETTAEQLFLEQAKIYYRDLRAAGMNAPLGKGLANAEDVALKQGRELIRQSLEMAAQEGIQDLEKKKKTDSVSVAENEPIADTPKSKPLLPSDR